MICAPTRASQPPINTIRNRATLTRSSRMMTALVAFDEALSRLGRSMTTSSAIRDADHTIEARRVHQFTHAHAGVVELADTPALGAGGESRGGSNPSARTGAVLREEARRRCVIPLTPPGLTGCRPGHGGCYARRTRAGSRRRVGRLVADRSAG